MTTKKNHVLIVLDDSGSMKHLAAAARQAFNQLTKTIREQARQNDQETTVSFLKFGVNVLVDFSFANVETLKDLTFRTYNPSQGSTALRDGIGKAIELAENKRDTCRADEDVSFLLIVITDGEENSSRNYNASELSWLIKKVQATDRYTITVQVPPGAKHSTARALGVPEGNVMEWEQSAQGVEQANQVTTRSIGGYFAARSKGATKSDTFYADLEDVKETVAERILTELSQNVLIWNVQGSDIRIDELSKKAIGSYTPGTVFYEVTKWEKAVQKEKQILIQSKSTGKIYGGDDARKLLGIPVGKSFRMSKGKHGDWRLFVQSASDNRKILRGTTAIYWAGAPRTNLRTQRSAFSGAGAR